MTTVYHNNYSQQATYWPPLGNTGQGTVSYGQPALIACRWQDQQTLVRNGAGHEVTCESIVYVDRRLEQQGYLALGDYRSDGTSDGFPDPKALAAARQIQALGASPSRDASVEVLKVWL